MAEPLQSNKRLPVLYSFRRCPYAMRARMAINQSNKTVELREVVLRDKPSHDKIVTEGDRTSFMVGKW